MWTSNTPSDSQKETAQSTAETCSLLAFLREARDTVRASTAESDISDDRKAYRQDLYERLEVALTAHKHEALQAEVVVGTMLATDDSVKAHSPHWRTGRSLGRTLYRDEVFVGAVDTREIAEEIVRTMNCSAGVWPTEDEDWLQEDRFAWFRAGLCYASTQTQAVPALSQTKPEDLFFAVTCILRGVRLRGHFHSPEFLRSFGAPVGPQEVLAIRADLLALADEVLRQEICAATGCVHTACHRTIQTPAPELARGLRKLLLDYSTASPWRPVTETEPRANELVLVLPRSKDYGQLPVVDERMGHGRWSGQGDSLSADTFEFYMPVPAWPTRDKNESDD